MLLRSIALALLALALAVPAAQADDFTPVPLPAPGRVLAFAASGDVWLASMASDNGTNTLWRTGDGGQSWQQLDLQTDEDVRASVGPDGAFYVTAGARLLRYDPAGGPGQDVPYGMPTQSGELAAPAWDGQGRMWIERYDSDEQGTTTLRVARVENGAAVDQASVVDPGPTYSIGLDPSGPIVFVSDGNATFRKDGAALVKVADEAGLPVTRAGDLTFFEGGVSEDGGLTIEPDSSPDLQPVHGSPDLFLDVFHGAIVGRFSSWLLRSTALTAPDASSSAWISASGIVVATRPSADRPMIAFHRGTTPSAPATTGSPSASSRRMVGRANVLRRAAGLPPLIVDGGISRAADNHSAYWTRNRFPRQVLDLHSERPGTPGFTGKDPFVRCEAVGAECGAEVMFPGMREAPAVDGWAATTYHGNIVMGPLELLAGGAVHGRGPAVMDLDTGSGLQLAPVGYPAGRYRGPLAFSGEAPDPGTKCTGGHATAPYGTSIRPFVPSGGQIVRVSLKRHGARVRGCQADRTFLPDDPLRAHSKYSATAVWRIGAGRARSYTWTFST